MNLACFLHSYDASLLLILYDDANLITLSFDAFMNQ